MMQRHMPIGYRMEDGKIHVNSEKAEVVRMIFREYLSGASTYALAKKLTEMGFLNANHKPSWNHGSIGKVLENTRYLGDELYPELIEKEVFERVQSRREEQCRTLGRHAQPNSMKNKSTFSGFLRCGECGEVFRKYTEHCGKPSERSNWKCKKYIYKNRVHCQCGVVTDEQIQQTFLTAIEKLSRSPGNPDKKIKEEPYRCSLECRRLEQKIKEQEAEGRFGRELVGLIFQRAAAAYQTAEVKDDNHNAAIMKAELADRDLERFDEKLFQRIVKAMIVFKDGRIHTEFINGITIQQTYKIRKKG